MMARRPKIGDVYEIETTKGCGYAQYCFYEGGDPGASYGYLIRIIEGLHESSADPISVVLKPTLFWNYFALSAALHHQLVRYVATVPVPSHAADYPLMRASHGSDNSGLVLNWVILGSGENQKSPVLRHVRLLNEAEQKLSDSGIISFPDLQERIEEQYRPENDPVMLRSVRHWTEVECLEKKLRENRRS